MNNLTTLTMFAIFRAPVFVTFFVEVAIIRITICTKLTLMETLVI